MQHNHYDRRYDRGGVGRSVIPLLAGVVATLAIGGYFLFGPEGRRNRRNVERWLTRAKFEILDRMEQMEDVSEEQYHRIVDEVMSRYGYLKETGSEKLEEASRRFKARWQEMRDVARRAREEAERELRDEERRERASAGIPITTEADMPTNPPAIPPEGSGPTESMERGDRVP